MRFAVIADVHGNAHALSAVLGEISRAGVDAIAFLGDFVSDCADPEKTLAMMREASHEWPCWAVRGNREEYQIRYADGLEIWKPDSRTGSLLFTAGRLTAADIAYFRRLPLSIEASVNDGPSMWLCHGSPWETRALVTPGSDLLEQVLLRAAAQGRSMVLLGHSHKPFLLRGHGVLALNPGSAGLPEDGDPRACWALAQCGESGWSARLMRTAYDVEGAVKAIRARGLMDMAPWWSRCICHTLRTGVCLNSVLLERAYAIFASDSRAHDMEACFARAGRELGL